MPVMVQLNKVESDVKTILERIATALESINEKMEQKTVYYERGKVITFPQQEDDCAND